MITKFRHKFARGDTAYVIAHVNGVGHNPRIVEAVVMDVLYEQPPDGLDPALGDNGVSYRFMNPDAFHGVTNTVEMFCFRRRKNAEKMYLRIFGSEVRYGTSPDPQIEYLVHRDRIANRG